MFFRAFSDVFQMLLVFSKSPFYLFLSPMRELKVKGFWPLSVPKVCPFTEPIEVAVESEAAVEALLSNERLGLASVVRVRLNAICSLLLQPLKVPQNCPVCVFRLKPPFQLVRYS